MSDEFDPYYAWLGIPPKDQPPNHYRLLGVELFETNLDVIESAAFRQMGHVRTYQNGKHSRESQRLLNELSAAKISLLDPDKKRDYDELLRATIDSINAFLPDEPSDTTGHETSKSGGSSIHVIDFEPSTGSSDSAARSSSASAIRRRRPQTTARLPIVLGVIGAVMCLGVAVMFGSKLFRQEQQRVVSHLSTPTNEPPTQVPELGQPVDLSTQNPHPANPQPVASAPSEGVQQSATTPSSNSNAITTAPAKPIPVTAFNDAMRRSPRMPPAMLQMRQRLPIVPYVRDKVEEAAGIADDNFVMTQTMAYNEFLNNANQLRNLAYRPLRIRPYLVDSESRIASVWTRDAVDWRMVLGVDANTLTQADQALKDQGYHPIDVACWQADGTKFAAVWALDESQSGEHELMLGLTSESFPAAAATARARGLMPLSHHVSDTAQGDRLYSVVWHKPEKVMPWHHWDDDREEHESALKRPGAPQDVCLEYLSNGDLIYGGLLVGLPDPNAIELHGYDAEDHRTQCRDLASKGYRPIAIAAASPRGGQQTVTASIWQHGAGVGLSPVMAGTSTPDPTSMSAAMTHALRFDGSALVTITNTGDLATRQNTFTAELWFRCTEPSIKEGYVLMGTTAHRDPPVGSNIGTASGWHVTAGKIQGPADTQETALRYASAKGSIRGSGSPIAPLGNDWHHLAVCNSPADGNFKLDVFLDGTRTQSSPRSLSDAMLSVTDFFLGKSVYLPDRHAFIGDIKAFRMSSDVRYQDSFTPPQAFTSDNSTVVLLNFDGNSTDYVADISGNEHRGTISGAKWIAIDAASPNDTPQATANVVAKATHALRSSGSDSIMIGNSRELAATSKTFTAELWFRFVEPVPQQTYVLMGTSAYRGQHPEVASVETTGWFIVAGQWKDGSSHSTGLRWSGPVGRIIGLEATLPPLGNDWHHLAVCNTPMGDDTWQMQVFVDGQRKQSVTRSREEAVASPSDFFLGRSQFLTDRHVFVGDIKAFRLSSNVRYQATFKPPGEFTSDASTLTLLDFSGENSSRILDLSGNNRHGTISGAKWVTVDDPPTSAMAATSGPTTIETLSEARLAVPSGQDRQEASKRVKDIFATDFEAAKDKPAMIALAKDLLQRGKEEQDAVAKFALLYEARALTLDAADLPMAMKATDEFSAWFEVDSWTLKCDTLTRLASSTRPDVDRQSVATTSLELTDEAMSNSDWDSAEKLLMAATRVNVRLKDREIVRSVNQKRKLVQTQRKLWTEAEQAATLLATSPDDAAANLKLGRYRCFVKGEWDVGLQHFAKGSDSELATIAVAETKNPQGSDALALANQWYEWADKAADADKNGALLRARHWYSSALPSLTGLDRTVAEKRLEELKDKVDEPSSNGRQLAWLNGPVGELMRLEGHTAEVTSLDVSRSGTMVVSGSNDGTVRFWDLADGKETGLVTSSVGRITRVALFRDDQFVFVAGNRTTAEVWNARTGRPATSMTIPASTASAALSEDDKILACARRSSSNGNITLYNMGTGAAGLQLNCPSYPNSVAISRSGRLVAAGSGDNNVYAWNIASGQLAGPFTGLGSNPNDVVISPNEQLVAGCVSNQVMIWELASGNMLSRTTALSYTAQLAFSPDNRRILCAGMMHELSVINVEDGSVIRTLRGQTRSSISSARAVTYLPDPRGAVSAGYDGIIRVWRLPD
ncbi:MAG: hypothetical protein H6823_11825 [Planctomycetaceae bacterium]|nr:hypothetical protein [Planctomycetaceae bacterium]